MASRMLHKRRQILYRSKSKITEVPSSSGGAGHSIDEGLEGRPSRLRGIPSSVREMMS